jgi:hypothetical protein
VYVDGEGMEKRGSIAKKIGAHLEFYEFSKAIPKEP